MALSFDERQRRATYKDLVIKQYPDLFKVPAVPPPPLPPEFTNPPAGIFDHKTVASFRPGQIIVDDIEPQREPMKLFTFATTKPPPATIWKTLMESDIKPSDGLSVMQIRYLIFNFLQTADSFVTAKDYINSILSTPQQPGAWARGNIPLSELRKVITDIPDHFPNWVGDDLYVPYYIAKQLGHVVRFDRETITDLEHEHLRIDLDEGESRYTAYSLWLYEPDLMQFFKIDMSLSPITVADRDHLVAILRSEIDTKLKDNDGIISVTDKITIPPFVLGTPNEA